LICAGNRHKKTLRERHPQGVVSYSGSQHKTETKWTHLLSVISPRDASRPTSTFAVERTRKGV
jgi:hypothetical protein